MAEDQEDRTEEATDAKREESRKKGQVAQTKELASALMLLAGAGAIFMMSKFFFHHTYEVFVYSFGDQMVLLLREGDIKEALVFASSRAALLIMPVLGMGLIISIFSSLAQVGFLNVEDAITPDLNKINPMTGFSRIFSLRSLSEAIKSILKILIIGFVIYGVLAGEAHRIPQLMEFGIAETLVYIGTIMFKLLFTVGLCLLVIATADYFFLRWDNEQKMRMSKQEIKEEMKQREGDPQIKARIKRVQREIANRRMMDAVPKADVVITNPTHLAIVLKYSDNLPAPQLVAKGADMIAEKIKDIARANNIPIIENKPLARTIFKTLKIGQVIPRELFVAVAEVLSYVYRLKKKMKNKI
ncbi:MAG: flagellar biosynthesis protein FlhB [Pseudobdellovibrionaceae bacterium]